MQGFTGQIAIAGTEIGDAAVQICRQMGSEQCGGRIDAVPGEQAGPTDEAAIANWPRHVECRPFRKHARIDLGRIEWAPEHPAVMLGDDLRVTENAAEIRFSRACALVVGHRGDHDAAGLGMPCRMRKQGPSLITLARRQDHHA